MKRGPARIAVTRDEGPDGPLSSALRAHGLEPVPCAAVRQAEAPDPGALRAAARSLARYHWLVVAHRRAVTALLSASGDASLPSHLRTAAVGPSTAAALIECGAVNPLTAEREGEAALREALRDADRWPGKRVLVPRAEEGGRELADALRAAGAEVDEVVAYRTVSVPPAELAAAWNRAQPEGTVVASPSAARVLVAALGAAALSRLAVVVAIGPTTAAALAELGIPSCTPGRAEFGAAAQLAAERLGVETGARS